MKNSIRRLTHQYKNLEIKAYRVQNLIETQKNKEKDKTDT